MTELAPESSMQPAVPRFVDLTAPQIAALPEDTVACQHGPEEQEILAIVSQLPLEDRIALVRIANDLLMTFRRWELGQGKSGAGDHLDEPLKRRRTRA